VALKFFLVRPESRVRMCWERAKAKLTMRWSEREKQGLEPQCYEPPPEFPLASPWSGIVHHLSGPNRYALTQIFQWMNDRSIVPLFGSYLTLHNIKLHFHYAFGFTGPNTCIYVRLLGPCFKTGQWTPFCQNREHAVKWIHSRKLRALQSFALHTTQLNRYTHLQPCGACYRCRWPQTRSAALMIRQISLS